MPVYGSAELMAKLKRGFAAAGKKLDIGKACIHFHTADDLALDVIADIIARMPLARWVEIAKSVRRTYLVPRIPPPPDRFGPAPSSPPSTRPVP
jgi:hypothetical protein